MTSQRITLATGLILIGLVVLAACGGGTTPAPATSAPAPATSAPATSAPATATSAPGTATSAPPTATSAPAASPTSGGQQVTFQFVQALSTIEEMEDIAALLHDVPGVLSVEGNENKITIHYDTGVITEDDLRKTMGDIGHPVQPSG